MQMIKAELVLWVAGFVLLSLIVNAPMLPWIMRITRLNIGMTSMLLAVCASSSTLVIFCETSPRLRQLCVAIGSCTFVPCSLRLHDTKH